MGSEMCIRDRSRCIIISKIVFSDISGIISPDLPGPRHNQMLCCTDPRKLAGWWIGGLTEDRFFSQIRLRGLRVQMIVLTHRGPVRVPQQATCLHATPVSLPSWRIGFRLANIKYRVWPKGFSYIVTALQRLLCFRFLQAKTCIVCDW